MLITLYGFLDEDFLGRVISIDDARTIQELAVQLQSWGPDLYSNSRRTVMLTNEQGVVLDPTSRVSQVGLSAGDIFHVRSADP